MGLIGGISWISTADYYSYLNRMVNDRLGEGHFARLILYSFDYSEIVNTVGAGRFDEGRVLFLKAAHTLVKAGAEGILLCANTAHIYVNDVEEATGLKVIHIADASSLVIHDSG